MKILLVFLHTQAKVGQSIAELNALEQLIESSRDLDRLYVYPNRQFVTKSTLLRNLKTFELGKFSLGNFLVFMRWLISKRRLVFMPRFLGRVLKLQYLAMINKIDLVLFLGPNPLASHVTLNSVQTIWDLGHREKHFLEFAAEDYQVSREKTVIEALRNSKKVIVESKRLKNILVDSYSAAADQVEIVHFLPSHCQSWKRTLRDNEAFAFYPAMYWQHKNHIVLLKAMRLALDLNQIPIPVVFSGKDGGYLQFLQDFAKHSRIESYVDFRGFLDMVELSKLIQECSKLLMPSFIGPTNLPPLEGLYFGKEVWISTTHYFDQRLMRFMNLADPIDVKQWSFALTNQASSNSERDKEIEIIFDEMRCENLKTFERILNFYR